MSELTFIVLCLLGFLVLGLTLIGVSVFVLIISILVKEWRAYAKEWEVIDD